VGVVTAASIAGRSRRRALAGTARPSRLAVVIALAALVLVVLGLSSGRSSVAMAFGSGPLASGPILEAPVWTVCIVLAAVCGALAVVVGMRRSPGWVNGVATACAVFAFVVGLFAWAARDGKVNMSGMFALSIAGAVPIILGSSAAVLSERSGVINIAVEAEFLAGAFTGALVGSVTGNLWVGLAAAIVGGTLVGLLLAVLTLRFGVDEIVAGIILISLLLGLTGFLTEQVLNPNTSSLNSPPVFATVGIPVLNRLPGVGRALFQQNVLFYVAVAVVVALEVVLRRTRVGLRLRAAGEHAAAASSSGVDVTRLRAGAVLISGAIAGAGGAYFTLGSAGQFVAVMTSGLGYVALASVILGRRQPLLAAAGAVLFGFARSLSVVFGLLSVDISPALLLAVPYLVTIAVVAGTSSRRRAARVSTT